MTNHKAWVFVKLLGRGGARVFYCIVGFVISVLGVLVTFGIVTG